MAPCTISGTWCLFRFYEGGYEHDNQHTGGTIMQPSAKGIYRSLPKLTPAQFRKVKQLTNRCCNKDQGNCLLLDDGESVPCVQAISMSVVCRYFREAVLPSNEALYAELFPAQKQQRLRRCAVCGSRFLPRAPNAKYCRSCATSVRRKQKAKSEQKRRARGHSGGK